MYDYTLNTYACFGFRHHLDNTIFIDFILFLKITTLHL